MWDALAPGPGMDPITPALEVLTTVKTSQASPKRKILRNNLTLYIQELKEKKY